MSTPEGSVATTGQLGERRLTTIHAIGQSLAVGPIFSAGLLTGLVASVAGFTTPLSVLLGTIGALALGYVISVFAKRYAGAVAWLAGDDASFVTGATVVVDGGATPVDVATTPFWP